MSQNPNHQASNFKIIYRTEKGKQHIYRYIRDRTGTGQRQDRDRDSTGTESEVK
jgi:hypothetical protein